MHRIVVFIVFLALCLPIGIPYVYGANSLQTVDNGASERFTITSALAGLQNISDWLKSFRALTILTADRITHQEKQQVGNLDADMQTLGFYNWVKSVEGTLLKQDCDIRKLEFELSLERLAAGKVSQAELTEKEKKYQEARRDFQEFLIKFHIAD